MSLRTWIGVGIVVISGRCFSAPVEWLVSQGGNGHFYDLVKPAGGINWTNASTAAQASTFRGAAGHLATVTLNSGMYVYRTSVNLSGVNPATAEIAGLRFAGDDGLTKVAVNGVDILNYGGPNGFNAWHQLPNFGAGAFREGLNTVDFFVLNVNTGPSGFRMEGSVMANVPEPGGVIGLMLGVTVFGRRRVKG